MGTVVYTCLIAVMQYKVAIETATWTWVTHLFLWFGSLFFFLFFLCVYSLMRAPHLSLCSPLSENGFPAKH